MIPRRTFRLVRPLGRFGSTYRISIYRYFVYCLWYSLCLLIAISFGVISIFPKNIDYFGMFHYWAAPFGIVMCGVGLIGLEIIARLGGPIVANVRSNGEIDQ